MGPAVSPSACLVSLFFIVVGLLALIFLVDWKEFTRQVGCPYCGAPETHLSGWMICPECKKAFYR